MNEIRTQLDERLQLIEDGLLAMTNTVTERIELVTAALLEGDVDKADLLIVGDDEIDLQSLQVEEACISTLLREQPVASDLRFIVAAQHMNTDIERSGDLTTNIAKAVGRLQGAHPDDRVRDLILQMSEQAQILLQKSAEAFEKRDLEMAKSIDDLDDVLDELHYRYIDTVINNAKEGGLIPQQSLQYALIGRFYERIGDHAENWGERIRYIIEGWQPEQQGADRAKAKQAAGSLDLDAPVPSRGLAVIDAEAEERRIDAIRRDFVANVSHELKTPVGAINLLAETLSAETDPAARETLVGHLNLEVRRIENIIDDLLELSRIEERPPATTEVEVDAMISEAVETIHALARARDIDVAVVGVPTNATVQGEQRQLVTALANLLQNAVRYSDDNTQVTVTAQSLESHIEIAVKDEGVGIPRSDLARIFERFYRVDPARSRETGGTGLGLSIVRHTIENHGGRVLVESKPGSGSTFTLEFPHDGHRPGAGE